VSLHLALVIAYAGIVLGTRAVAICTAGFLAAFVGIFLLQRHGPLPHSLPPEMQDTFERQASFLNTIFPRSTDKSIVQRVGDPNQEIFDLPDSDSGTTDPFPALG
jgi:hypothetical protein